MFFVYEQRWTNDSRVSIHRSPSDILEFSRNHSPILIRDGYHKEVKQNDYKLAQDLEGTLGKWK